MAVTYGFYNSVNGDRKYNAEQMAQIFDGIINDGVFSSVGTAFSVTPSSGMIISIGAGRAWFNHTWTYNDAAITLTVSTAPTGTLKRIDAVVIEVNTNTRVNTIKMVNGTQAASPVRPTLVNTGGVYQYALAYITVAAGTTTITSTMIAGVVGTDTPFVTGPLETVGVTALYDYWRAEFETWFDHLQDELDSNQAANLQHQIDDISAVVMGHDIAQLWIWNKQTYQAPYIARGDDVGRHIIRTTGSSTASTWWYGTSVSIVDGQIELGGTRGTISVSYNTNYNPTVLAGKYAYTSTSTENMTAYQIYYFPSSCTFTRGTSGNYYQILANPTNVVSIHPAVKTHVDYVSSYDSGAYPNGALESGYWYDRLGQIGDFKQINTGSYTGTGTYGSGSPNVLTFDFEPKLLLVQGVSTGSIYSAVAGYFYVIAGCTMARSYETGSTSYYVTITWSGNTVSWYNDSADDYQLNKSNAVYHYVAIG